MYKYENSFTLKVRSGSIYDSPSLEFEPVSNLYTDYYRVILQLSHPASSVPLYLDMSLLRIKLGGYLGNVKSWLELNGTAALPVTTDKPNLSLRFARYAELTSKGYELFLTNEGLYYPETVDRNNLHDIGVRRSNSDMKFINDTSLATVNGFVHDSSASQNTMFIRGGHGSAKKANTFAAGIVSFGDIGALTRHKLKTEFIEEFETDTPIAEKLRFRVPGIDPNKAFFLVLGGYLIFPQEGIFYRTEEDGFALNLNRLNIVEKLLESVNFIDLTSLNLIQPNNMLQPGWFTSDILSKEVIQRYMVLSQSFLVTVDAPSIGVKRNVLTNEPYPGKFLVAAEPVNPIMGGHGRLFEYWPIETKIGWNIDCADNFRRNYIFSESGPNRHKQVDATEDITQRARLSGAYSLEIYSSI